jgi:hypothetical protein
MKMDHVVAFNRNTLKSVDFWIRRQDWESPPTLFNYGLPPYVFHLIDKDISLQITEADVLCTYMLEIAEKSFPVRYLEIGVSVGKTFYQIVKFAQEHLRNQTIHCLDIEKVNPTLKKLLDAAVGSEAECSAIPCRPRKEPIRQKEENVILRWNRGEIVYHEADEFDDDIWKSMTSKYNIIFSDALHEPQALLQEYAQLKNNDLIDGRGFVYCFDDLEENKVNGPMWRVVQEIYQDLFEQYPDVALEHLTVNGWLGQHEAKHHFGVISGGMKKPRKFSSLRGRLKVASVLVARFGKCRGLWEMRSAPGRS